MTISIAIRTSTRSDTDRHRASWAVLPADRTTPVLAFERLRAAGHRASLLESVEGPARLARFSFVALDPDASLRVKRGDGRAPHEALRAARIEHRTLEHRRHPDLPPFRGGWIGAFAWEFASALEPRIPRIETDPFGAPDASFDHFPDVVAFDHGRQVMTVLCAAPRGAADHDAARERVERIVDELGREAPESEGVRLAEGGVHEHTDADTYCAGVERLRAEIAAGEIFQAVLARRFSHDFEGDPFTLYRVLRLVNPAPHMFFHEADDITLVGSSPERLVRVDDGRIQLVPIAGTRPRGADDDEDERFAAELRRDEKERAEHDMLVDLARNDAGRVARVGTVRVREHAILERFPRVQHLVSRVDAELAHGHDALDALAAAFPAGTVSGAPKVRAMELIAEVEREARGPYAGAFGYLDDAGTFDAAITIRTIVCTRGAGDQRTAHVQAGAGIVFESDPESERRETEHKASALLEAIELAGSPAFQPTAMSDAPLARASR